MNISSDINKQDIFDRKLISKQTVLEYEFATRNIRDLFVETKVKEGWVDSGQVLSNGKHYCRISKTEYEE